MKVPTHTIHNNLRFTRSGQVWADFVLSGAPYGLRDEAGKKAAYQLHLALLRSLPQESLLLGVVAQTSPDQLRQRMMAGIDPDACPAWVDECEATLEILGMIQPGHRVFWLSVPLPAQRGYGPVRAAWQDLQVQLGLPRPAPGRTALRHYQEAADQVLRAIPAPFTPVPATPAQMVWLHNHLTDRGLYADPDLPAGAGGWMSGSALAGPMLDEGGQTDRATGRGLLAHTPAWPATVRDRYLKVEVVDPALTETAASYQSMMILAGVPADTIPFPGGELLGCLDYCGVSVDWALRVTTRTPAQVARANERAVAALNEQWDQLAGDETGLTTTAALVSAAGLLREYAEVMDADQQEIECRTTLVLAVGGGSPDHAMLAAQQVADWVQQLGYRVAQPLGHQTTMWWAMHPGVPDSGLVSAYSQITTSAGLSALMPLVTSQVGDPVGIPLGLNITSGPMQSATATCGPAQLVTIDPEHATDRHVAPALMLAGELGSGKSYAAKKVAGAVLDRGGQLVVVDRTPMGEWARWAAALTDPRVVDLSHPEWSLDPLRLYGPEDGSGPAQAFIGQLLGLAPASDEGGLLAEVLDPDYLRDHQLKSLDQVWKHLKDGCTLDGAQSLGRRIHRFAREKLAQAAFDPSLPAMTMGDRAVVIRTQDLDLPTLDELQQPHLFAQLPVSKLLGRALHALVMAYAKRAAFRDIDTLAALVCDEIHVLTSSPETLQELVDFVHDGRKHRAMLIGGCHDPLSALPTVMRGLIGYRWLGRHTDPTLAQRGLEWLGLNPDDPALLRLVTEDTSPLLGGEIPTWRRGEGLLRDPSGAVGRVRVLPPGIRARDLAARTGGRADREGAA